MDGQLTALFLLQKSILYFGFYDSQSFPDIL